jgi:hypothetical protein
MLFDFKYNIISEAELDVQLTRHVRKRLGQLYECFNRASGVRIPPSLPTIPTPG